MKKSLFVTLGVFLVVALCFFGIYYYFYFEPRAQSEVSLYGNVDVRQVELGFRVPGRLTTLYVQEGDLVEPGKLLAEIETQPYTDELERAKASRAAAFLTLQNAEILYKRRLDLVNDGSISQEDLDNAFTQHNVAIANLEEAEASLGVAQKNLDDTKVYAPSRGIILSRVREPGTVVRAADTVYTISVTDPVWVRAYVPETYLGWVVNGMEGKVFTDTPGIGPYKGRVGFISPVAEFTPKTVETSQLRTQLVYRIRLYIDHPDLGLRQGMPVTVKLQKKAS